MNSDSIVATLLNSDPCFEAAVVLREAAGKARLRHLTLEGIERAKAARPTPYRGPCYPGDIVQCYRHMKGTKENRQGGDVGVRDMRCYLGHRIGPCEVLCVESSNGEALSERILWLNYQGRLVMASPEQCRPLPVDAEKARRILAKFESEGHLYGPQAVRHLASQPTPIDRLLVRTQNRCDDFKRT